MKILTAFFAFCMVVATFSSATETTTTNAICKDVKCFAEKLQADRSNLDNWLNVASHMSMGEAVTVGTDEYAKPALVVAKAMEGSSQFSNASLWTQMAFYHRDYLHDREAAKQKEPAIEVQGKEYTRLEMLQKALTIDPNFSRAWVVLSSHLRSLEDPLTQELWTSGTEKLPQMKQIATINGKDYNARTAVDEAVRVNIDDSGAWVELGRFINDKVGETAVVDGKEYTRRQCFEVAVQRGPRDFLAWTLMGLELLTAPITFPKNPELTIFTNPAENDKVYTAQHALIKAIELEPKFSLAWARLADSLMPGTPQEVEILGNKFSKQQLYEQALRRDLHLATAWVSLAGTISSAGKDKTNPIHGVTYTAIGCLQKGLALNPRLGIAWTLLAQRLNRDEKAKIGDHQFTRVECFKNAVETDPKLPAAWGGLGTTFPGTGVKTVKLQYADDETMTEHEVTPLDCFVKALSLKHDFTPMYLSLSAHVRGNERVLIPGLPSPQPSADGDKEDPTSGFIDNLEATNGVGKEGWTAIQLLVRAAQTASPTQGEIVGFLAQRMFERKFRKITFASAFSGNQLKTWTAKELLTEALKTRSQYGNFWYALGGQLAGAEKSVEINGKTYTMFDCLVQTLTFTPRNAMAWVNLGMLMGQMKVPEVTIGKDTFQQKDAFARSLEINPDEDRVWQMITEVMENDEDDVVIRGRKFVKKDIVAELENMKAKRNKKASPNADL